MDEYVEAFPEHAERMRTFLAGAAPVSSASAGEKTTATVSLPLPEGSSVGSSSGAGGSRPALPGPLKQLQPGTAFGSYDLISILGKGGMGVVYQARHREEGRLVALKVVAAVAGKNDAALARFQREAKAAASLQHPNIVAAYEADTTEGIPFLALEFIPGDDLSHLVKKGGVLPPAMAVRCILDAARGLGYAHGRGIIHRDVKPSNLLLDATTGQVKVLDLGLARVEALLDEATRPTELTSTGTMFGTVDYMAPEQARDAKRADPRADVYSLGCTLFYLLTGRAVYPAENMLQKLRLHREGVIPRLTAAASGTPNRLDAVFRKMVAKRPDDRQATMADVIADLEEALAVLEDRAPDSAPVSEELTQSYLRDEATQTYVSPPRRHRRLPLLAGLAGLLVIGLVAGLWTFLRVPRPDPMAETGGLSVEAPADGAGKTETTPTAVSARAVALVKQLDAAEQTLIEDGSGRAGEPSWGAYAGACEAAFGTFGIDLTRPAELQADLLKQLPRAFRERIIRVMDAWDVAADAAGQSDAAGRIRAITGLVDADAWRGRVRSVRANPGAAGILSIVAEMSKAPTTDAAPHELIAQILLSRGLLKRPETLAFFRESTKALPNQFWPQVGLAMSLAEDAKNLTGEARLTQFDLELAALHAARSIKPNARMLDGPRVTVEKQVGSPKEERQFARWVLEKGGRVNLRPLKGQPHRHFEQVAMAEGHLPSEPFRIIGFSLSNQPIGDVDLASVPSLAFLEEAHLDGTKATDEGIRRLCKTHPSLSRINLERTKVTDVIIDALRDMKWLGLRNTAVTDGAARMLVADGKGPEVLHDAFAASMPPSAVSKWNKNGTALHLDWNTGVDLPIFLDMRKPLTIEGIVTREPVLQAVHSNPFHAGADLGDIHVNINRYSVCAAAIQTPSGGVAVTPQGRVEFDRPVHLAMVFEGKELRLYQDGKRVGAVTVDSFTAPDRAGCYINHGGQPWAVWRFVGLIREVRFSSIARYDKDFTPVERFEPDEHTVGLYHLDEGKGDVARDSSGKNNHGKIVNARWVSGPGKK
ncbi:MAG: protein kinase [Gemmataceae bacterium]